ncbi:hypothetical protein LZ480_07845 [Solibacillus sp. MA9]|uniref:Uncharacterized protein n=1 Tax=Solibacillus palustris TaxID=2908203 RepID=A0ABS9UCS3_9BACL|nr:hypothetical protein [Solibacillus sp. MA9]MCH7321805.1 hypothetical protein [Solibacillus sp. MA9]
MNYLQKNQRYTLYKLKNEIADFNYVQNEILEKKFREKLSTKNIPENIPEEDKYFISQWVSSSEETEVNFPNDDIKFKYKKALASCEFTTRQIKDSVTGILLPKKERLNTSLIDVLFIEWNDNYYMIVFSTEFYDLRRIKNLVGENLIDPITAIHQINSELFNWLFYKFIQKDFQINEEIYLDNINGFTGNVINEDNQFEGRSTQTAELIITKAFLTNGYPITSIKMDLQMPEATMTFYLREISNDNKELQMVVAKNSSIDLPITPEDKAVIIPMYLYLYLIPKIVKIYKAIEKSYLSSNKNEFLTSIGIEVIKTIMAKNNISIKELE